MIDQHFGVKGDIIPVGAPVKRMIPGADQNKSGWIKDNGREYQPGTYMPVTDEAAQWSGWSYGGQAQKPAFEPIYLAQKPFSEKNGAANILKHGVGAVNIDGCRTERGNWPANLFHDGSPEVVAMFPREAGAKAPVKGTEPTKNGYSGAVKYGGMIGRVNAEHTYYNDIGSAANFFNSFRYTCETCQDQGWYVVGQDYNNPYGEQAQCPDCAFALPTDTIPPIFYNPKAAKGDRAGSKHPTVKPIALMQHLVRHITPPGGTVLDMFAGSGTTAEAARREGFDTILMEADEDYLQFLRQRFDLPGGLKIDLSDLLGGNDIKIDIEDLLA